MPAKQHLVCQHLENISRDALGKYQAVIKRYVRRRHGVYALYRRNKLYHVGPAGDKVQGKFPHSEDLRRKFGSEIRRRLQDEFSALLGRSYEEDSRKPAKVIPAKGARGSSSGPASAGTAGSA